MKANLPKKDKNDYMSSPCTIKEAVQIARGVAEDVVVDYQHQTGHLHVALSLQVETLKKLLFKSGIIKEEEFKDEYLAQVEEFNAMQSRASQESIKSDSDDNSDPALPKTSISAGEIEVEKV